MAKGPDDVLKVVTSAWQKKIAKFEEIVDQRIDEATSLPISVDVTELDPDQRIELCNRYTAAKWRKVWIKYYQGDERDPRDRSYYAIVLEA